MTLSRRDLEAIRGIVRQELERFLGAAAAKEASRLAACARR